MRQRKGYLPKDGNYPFLGLFTLSPGTMAPPMSALVCENVLVSKGSAYRRKGYTVINTGAEAVPVVGDPVELINFRDTNNNEFLVLVTTSNMYKLSGTAWVDITPKYDKVVVVCTSEAGGAFAVGATVTQTNSGAKGIYLSKSGSPGSVSLSIVTGVFTKNAVDTIVKDGTPADYFTPDDSTPPVVTANDGGTAAWTGDTNDLVDYTTMTGTQGTWLILTNGKDEVVYWDGSRTNFTPLRNHASFSYGGFTTCKCVASYSNHLLLGGIKTTAWDYRTVAWTTANSLVDFASGTSGVATIAGVKGTITKMRPLGDRLAFYSEEEIGLIAYVGEPSIFVFEGLVNDTRLTSPKAIAELGPFHLFMSKDNIQMFDGSRQQRSIGDYIVNEYREKLSIEYVKRSFTFVDRAKSHIYFCTPTSSTETITYFLEYDQFDVNQMSMRWSKITHAKRIVAMSFFSQGSSLAWNSPEIDGKTWASMSGRWNQSSAKKNFPVRYLMFSDKTLAKADDTSGLDGSTSYTGTYESVDFVVPVDYKSELGRWLEVEAELAGSGTVTFKYSIDEGRTYTTLGTASLLTEFQKLRFDVDIASRQFRVQISSTQSFEIRWYRVWLRPVGAQ
jgi:hypothetical protein